MQSHPEIQPEMRSSPCQGQPLNDSSRPARTSVTPAPEAAEATAKPAGVTSFSNGENVFHHRSFQSEEATESPSHAPDQGSLHPDHLLPEDVLQRARSIINEHLAEHRMPLVDSLSDFTLQDFPSSQPGASRYPVGKTSGPAHRRTSARTRDADSTDAYAYPPTSSLVHLRLCCWTTLSQCSCTAASSLCHHLVQCLHRHVTAGQHCIRP